MFVVPKLKLSSPAPVVPDILPIHHSTFDMLAFTCIQDWYWYSAVEDIEIFLKIICN